MSILWRGLCAALCFGLLLTAHTRAEGQEDQTCPHVEGWKPTDEELKRIMASHQQWAVEWEKAGYSEEWVSQHRQGRAHLCNANLGDADLTGADLRGADLSGADLRETKLYVGRWGGLGMVVADIPQDKTKWDQLQQS